MTEQFKSPDPIYRGTDFWMLNDRLDDDEIRWQVKEFHDKGMHEFIARTYVGLRTDYPGPEWKHRIQVMLEEATKYGMRVTLQPLRMPGGFKENPITDVLDVIECVTKEYFESEEYEQRELFDEVIGENETYGSVIKDLGKHIIVRRKDGGKDDDGNWDGGRLNMFSAEKCQKYVKLCYEENWEEFRKYFGNTIHTMWVDEPLVGAHSLPYPEGIEKAFFDRWGYKIEDHFEELFFNVGDYKRIRYQYMVLLQYLMEHGYFETLSHWCKANNIRFSGHLFNEDSLSTQIFGAIATMPFYKYLDIPGMDTLEADMAWRYGKIKPAYSREYIGYQEIGGSEMAPNGLMAAPMATIGMYTTPLQLTSAAHQAGKEHILCEMFGVTTHNFTFRDQRHLFDHLAALGINHKCIHAFFYNLHGTAKRAFPHQVNYYQPYWENYSDMFSYFSRTSWFISQGKPQKDVMVVHPLDTAYMLYENSIDNTFSENSPMRDYERFYYGLVRGLCGMQCRFEFGDEATIGDWGKVTDSGFEIGEMTYKTVVLPYLQVLRKKSAELIAEYAKKGGKVYILGTMPDRIDGVTDDSLPEMLLNAGCVFCETRKELFDILEQQNGGYSISCTSDITPIIVNHRADEKRDYFFIMNDFCEDDKEITLTVDGGKKAVKWDALTGTTEEIAVTRADGKTSLSVTIPEGGSIMVSFEDAAECMAPVADGGYFTRALPDKWEITRHDRNALVIEDCRYKRETDADYSENTYPAIVISGLLNDEEYEGNVYLKYNFTSEKEMQLQLALEDLALSEVWFNGVKAAADKKGIFRAHAFEVIDLPENCKKGENEIIIKKAFQPATKMGGLESNQERVDLESIYIIGDFGVFSREEPVNNGTHRFSRFFTLGEEKTTAYKDVTSVGYPFYAGSMSLTQKVNICEEELKNDKILFTFEEFNGCIAEIIVNGTSLGNIYWAPYEIDIKSALKAGENEITVKITNCLRNLLGPYHRVQGEIGHVWTYTTTGDIYSNVAGPWGGNPHNPDWYNHRDVDDAWWTPDYFLLPFGLGKVKLKMFK